MVVDFGSLEDFYGRKKGQLCSAIAFGSSLGALQRRIRVNLSWSPQEQRVFEETVTTLEARQACRRQSKQRQSVSFHHPPADASLQKEWLVAIPLTNIPISSKRMPMFAESTSSGDVDRVVFQP